MLLVRVLLDSSGSFTTCVASSTRMRNFPLTDTPVGTLNLTFAGTPWLKAFWMAAVVIRAFPCAARCTQRRSGMTPAARWNASSRSMGGIEAAKGL